MPSPPPSPSSPSLPIKNHSSPSSSTALRALRINQLSPPATQWLLSVLSALDAKDLSLYLTFLSPSVTIIFNNGELTLNGLDAAREGLARFWQSFATIRHEEMNIYGTDRNFVHEALNHYTALDGRSVTVRAVAFVDRDQEGRIEGLRVYGDQTPLWVRKEGGEGIGA